MHDKILKKMQRAVRAGHIVYRSHVDDQLKARNLTRDDVKNCIYTGEIVADQYDPEYDQVKYKIYGDALSGDELGMIARWDDFNNVVVITVFRLRIEDYD